MKTNSSNHEKEPLFQYVKDCYWSIFRGNTAILSNTLRQLALGIGGVILFNQSNINLVSKIIFTLLVFFFIADAAQYLYQSYRFHKLAEIYDEKIKVGSIKNISALEEPKGMNIWTNRFFVIKIVILAVASLVFLIFLWTPK